MLTPPRPVRRRGSARPSGRSPTRRASAAPGSRPHRRASCPCGWRSGARAPLRRHARAGGELVPRVERQRRLAVAEREADPLALLLEDRPAEPLRVEAPRTREIADADSDQGDVRPHQYSSFWGRSSVISSQGAFEPTKMCSLGRILGASASDPSATWTYLPSRTTE